MAADRNASYFPAGVLREVFRKVSGMNAISQSPPGSASSPGGRDMGRNAFQRPKKEAIELLHAVMDIYKKAK